MWRRASFVAAALAVCALTVRADYLYVKIDVGNVYKNAPGGIGAGGFPGGFPGGVGLPKKPGEPDGPFVSAIIEIKSKVINEWKKDKENVEGGQKFDHPWGRDGRFLITPALANSIKYVKIERDSPQKEFEKSVKKVMASKDAAQIFALAKLAFRHGLLVEFKSTMDELAKLSPKLPAVVNYQRVATALRKPPTADDPALKSMIAELTRVDAAKYHWIAADSGWYAALTNLPPSFDLQVKRRVNRLQETLETFYFWFALHDELAQPELPKFRQLMILTNSSEEFYLRHSQAGSQPFVGDGLTTRRDNYVLTSWRPLGEVFTKFDQANQQVWKKIEFKKDALVSGTFWDKVGKNRDLYPLAFAQTLSIVEKALEEESELSTLSREGARQLLFASGILPRRVHTPEWIAQGLAAYFEVSPGAVYRGVGMPSWSNLTSFNYFRGAKKFDRPADVLTGVYTDHYYRAAQKGFGDLADATNKDKLADSLADQMDLANCTSWAFTYYVIERRNQPQLLFKYCQELNSLPRDLDLSDRALEGCFAKAFDVSEAGNPNRIDEKKLTKLADAWFSEMNGVALDVPSLQYQYLETRKLSARKRN